MAPHTSEITPNVSNASNNKLLINELKKYFEEKLQEQRDFYEAELQAKLQEQKDYYEAKLQEKKE